MIGAAFATQQMSSRYARSTARSRSAIPHDGYSSRTGARLANDPIAAFADAPGAATAHAGLLNDRGGAVVMVREPPFSEIHLNILWLVSVLRDGESER